MHISLQGVPLVLFTARLSAYQKTVKIKLDSILLVFSRHYWEIYIYLYIYLYILCPMRPSIIKMLNFVNSFVFRVVFFFNILNFTSCGTRIVKITIYVSSIISVNMCSQCERSNHYNFVKWRVTRV